MSCVEETSYGVFVRKVIEGNTRCCSQMYSWRSGVRVPAVARVSFSSRWSIPDLGLTQNPIQSVLAALVWSKLAVVWGWLSDPSSCELKNVWNCSSSFHIYFNGGYRNDFIVLLSFCCFPLAKCYVSSFKSILQLPFIIFLHHLSHFSVLLRKLAQNRKASVVGRFMFRPEHRLLWMGVPWFSTAPTDSADLVH